LRGFIVLRWDTTSSVTEVPAVDRIKHLSDNAALVLSNVEPGRWLNLLAKPMLQFARPRDWSQIDSAMTLLMETIEGLTAR
jgi:hypothetical protein